MEAIAPKGDEASRNTGIHLRSCSLSIINLETIAAMDAIAVPERYTGIYGTNESLVSAINPVLNIPIKLMSMPRRTIHAPSPLRAVTSRFFIELKTSKIIQ